MFIHFILGTIPHPRYNLLLQRQGWVGCPPKAHCCWQAAALGAKPRWPSHFQFVIGGLWPHTFFPICGELRLDKAPLLLAQWQRARPLSSPLLSTCRLLEGKGAVLLAWKEASVLCCFRPLGRPVEFQDFCASSSHTVNTTAWNACSLD